MDATDCVHELSEIGASVVLSTLHYSDSIERLTLPAKLEKAGIPLSFAASHPVALRRSAAIAVRHGLSRDAAFAALTRTPAEQLGATDSIGSLRNGHRADLAVYSGDPIDLTSDLLAVFVAGERLEKESK